MKTYITRNELAKLTKTSVSYWAQLAMAQKGPRPTEGLGRNSLYDMEDVEQFIDSKKARWARKQTKPGRPRKTRNHVRGEVT